MKFFTIVFLASLLSSTLSHANAFTREGGGTHAPTALIITFSSIGSGIDHNSEQVMARLLAKSKAAGQLENVIVKNFGFEGEKIVCAKFKNYDFSRRFAHDFYRIISQDNYRRTEFYHSTSCNDVNRF